MFGALKMSCMLLEDLVGAGRFERPTPCAQDGFRHSAKIVYFQRILFQ